MKIPMHEGSEEAFDILPKIEDYDHKGAKVKEDIEEGCRLKPEKMFHNPQMGRAGDGQPLCEALEQTKKCGHQELIEQTLSPWKNQYSFP